MKNNAAALDGVLPFPLSKDNQRQARLVSFKYMFADAACPIIAHGSMVEWNASAVEYAREIIADETTGSVEMSVAAIRHLLARIEDLEEQLGHDPEPSRAA